jgi:hypothetical protein
MVRVRSEPRYLRTDLADFFYVVLRSKSLGHRRWVGLEVFRGIAGGRTFVFASLGFIVSGEGT